MFSFFAWLVENKGTPKKHKTKRGANSGEDQESVPHFTGLCLCMRAATILNPSYGCHTPQTTQGPNPIAVKLFALRTKPRASPESPAPGAPQPSPSLDTR